MLCKNLETLATSASGQRRGACLLAGRLASSWTYPRRRLAALIRHGTTRSAASSQNQPGSTRRLPSALVADWCKVAAIVQFWHLIITSSQNFLDTKPGKYTSPVLGHRCVWSRSFASQHQMIASGLHSGFACLDTTANIAVYIGDHSRHGTTSSLMGNCGPFLAQSFV